MGLDNLGNPKPHRIQIHVKFSHKVTQQGYSGKRAALLVSVEQGDPPAGTWQAVKNILHAMPGHACTPPETKPAHAEPAPVSPHSGTLHPETEFILG